MSIDFTRFDDFCRLRKTVEQKVGWALPESTRARVVEKLVEHLDSSDPLVSLKAIGLLLQVERSNQAAVKVESSLLLQNRVMAPGEDWEEVRANNAARYGTGVLVRVPDEEPEVEDTPEDIEAIRRGAINQKREYGFWPPYALSKGYIDDLVEAETS